jgi:hypothetical protein
MSDLNEITEDLRNSIQQSIKRLSGIREEITKTRLENKSNPEYKNFIQLIDRALLRNICRYIHYGSYLKVALRTPLFQDL